MRLDSDSRIGPVKLIEKSEFSLVWPRVSPLSHLAAFGRELRVQLCERAKNTGLNELVCVALACVSAGARFSRRRRCSRAI